jgi:hypothetical protein
MEPKSRAVLVFIGATVGAAALHQAASRQAAKLGLPHAVAGAIIAAIDYAS